MAYVGKVIEIRRFPVKSMLGEVVPETAVTERGLEGDRVHGLLDPETKRVISVKRPKRWSRIFELTAATTAEGVVVSFPDGRVFGIEHADLPAALTEFFGRPVELVRVPIPQRAIFDEAWMDELNGELRLPVISNPAGRNVLWTVAGLTASRVACSTTAPCTS